MIAYVEMTRPPARQNLRLAWARQIINRRELFVPVHNDQLRAIGQKPLRPSSIALGPVHEAPQRKLQTRPVPRVGTFSRQVLGIGE